MKSKEKFPKTSNERLKKDGYPKYSDSKDIYNTFKDEFYTENENITKKKDPTKFDKKPTWDIINTDQNYPENDLDVPGSELDDDQENIGSEDEENNYYSLGGDNHNDLEEDK